MSQQPEQNNTLTEETEAQTEEKDKEENQEKQKEDNVMDDGKEEKKFDEEINNNNDSQTNIQKKQHIIQQKSQIIPSQIQNINNTKPNNNFDAPPRLNIDPTQVNWNLSTTTPSQHSRYNQFFGVPAMANKPATNNTAPHQQNTYNPNTTYINPYQQQYKIQIKQ